MRSDILAELDLPPSGISRYEHAYSKHCHPRGIAVSFWTDLQQNKVMYYYSAQLQLRRILNSIHSELYNVKPAVWPNKLCAELNRWLGDWRAALPNDLQWSDTDPQSADINAARMRAKYYCARYLIHRPFLHSAIHSMEPNCTSNAAVQQRSFPASVKHGKVDLEVYEASKICVEAAMKSTTAYDGVEGRLIVTDIFGTAHAYVLWSFSSCLDSNTEKSYRQFGNILVLAATYHAGLTDLISRHELEMLLNRTLDFLGRWQPISPSLAKDAEILRSVQKFLFKA